MQRSGPSQRHITEKMLGLVCVALLCGILYAGLKPFHSPSNGVAWVANSNALRFGEYGTVFSPDRFPAPGLGSMERSVEFRIRPGKVKDSNTVISFYDPASPRHISLRQDESDLVVYIDASVAWRSAKRDRLYIPNAFRDGKRAFWAVTFGKSGTAVYRDGALVVSSPLKASPGEFSGQLVVANSPIFDESWSGVLSGLAIYDSALNGAQIARHYASWAKGPAPAIASDDRCIGLYLFDEREGRVVHNRARSGNDLYIPPRYMVLRKTLLDPIWRAFSWHRGFWEDALINVGGFMPIGCFLCAYFSARGLTRPALRATALGAAVSLYIEVTQTFLPTRDSSMADLIDNILGSLLGAAAYRGWVVRVIDWGIGWIVRAAD